MTDKLLYFGPQWEGSTSLQRLHAFGKVEGIKAIGIDNGSSVGVTANTWNRIRWKLRIPADTEGENAKLILAIESHTPTYVFVDNSKVISAKTILEARALGVRHLIYYSPDDIVSRHNLSIPLQRSLPFWDFVCTTKTFNVQELIALGVKNPILVGKAFDPLLHIPLPKDELGSHFEAFDAVFVGTYEKERAASINSLADAGISVVVYGSDQGYWRSRVLHPRVTLRESAFGANYVRAWHTGKVGLCFLRKINRDRITQRTMEIAAMGRPMVAERTDEHDSHFLHDKEYFGFYNDVELVEGVFRLIADDSRRMQLAISGRLRCLNSGYSTVDRAKQMMSLFQR